MISVDEIVICADGVWRKVGDLRDGDRVFGYDGVPVQVQVGPVVAGEVASFVFDDENAVTVSRDREWWRVNPRLGRGVGYGDWISESSAEGVVPVVQELQYEFEGGSGVLEYLSGIYMSLGVGDGLMKPATRKALWLFDYLVEERLGDIQTPSPGLITTSKLKGYMDELGVVQGQVLPDNYRTSATRREFLRGVVDATRVKSGRNRAVTIHMRYGPVLFDTWEIAQSLGMRVTRRQVTEDVWSLYFYFDEEAPRRSRHRRIVSERERRAGEMVQVSTGGAGLALGWGMIPVKDDELV